MNGLYQNIKWTVFKPWVKYIWWLRVKLSNRSGRVKFMFGSKLNGLKTPSPEPNLFNKWVQKADLNLFNFLMGRPDSNLITRLRNRYPFKKQVPVYLFNPFIRLTCFAIKFIHEGMTISFNITCSFSSRLYLFKLLLELFNLATALFLFFLEINELLFF